MTVAYLTDQLGPEKVETFLHADPDEILGEAPPHHEVQAPIPEGIQPYFDAPPAQPHMPPGQIALMGAFEMPVADG